MGTFGPSLSPVAPSPGAYFGGDPPPTIYSSGDLQDEEPLVTWARNAAGVLKKERQEVTARMTESISLSKGGTGNIWKGRPQWKIGTRLNKCFSVPNKWASILTDNEQTINFNASRKEGQRTAAILTAAFLKAYTDNGWQRVIRGAVFDSRVQGIAYLSLRPDIFSKNKNQATLMSIPGVQVWVDRNALTPADAEVILFEYRQSYGKVVARFPDVRGKLERKYQNIYNPQNLSEGSQSSPPTTLAMPASSSWDGASTAGAYTVNNPPYTGTPNPPDEAGGSSGILIREFWTRNHKTVKVRTPMFTAAGEPATVPLELEYADGTTEPVRRIITEGNVVYELPQSLVDGLRALEPYGGVRILDEMDAVEVCFHKVDAMLYPDGRLLVIVDDSILPKDGNKLNPLGYMPFIPIVAHPLSSEYYPLSDIDLIKDAYEALIRLVSLMFDNAMLAGNSIWRIPENSNLQNDDITNAPGSIQREDPMTLKFGKREPAPDMPQFVMKLIEFYLQQIDELSGLTAAALGKQNAKAQQSTDSTLMNQEQASIDFRDAQRSLKYALTTLGQQFQEFVERFYTEPELVEIKNDLGQKEAVPLVGSHLSETFHVEAKPGSLMSSTPTARLTTAMNLIGSGLPLMDLPEIWKLLEEVGAITSARELEERISKERISPTDKWKVPGAEPKPKKQGGGAKKANSKRARAGQTQGAG